MSDTMLLLFSKYNDSWITSGHRVVVILLLYYCSCVVFSFIWQADVQVTGNHSKYRTRGRSRSTSRRWQAQHIDSQRRGDHRFNCLWTTATRYDDIRWHVAIVRQQRNITRILSQYLTDTGLLVEKQSIVYNTVALRLYTTVYNTTPVDSTMYLLLYVLPPPYSTVY